MKQTMSVDHVIKEFYNAVWKATYLTKTLDRESARSVIKLFNTYLKKNVVLVPEAKHIDEAFNIALEKVKGHFRTDAFTSTRACG
jgi:predicted nucleic acid-binding protein